MTQNRKTIPRMQLHPGAFFVSPAFLPAAGGAIQFLPFAQCAK